MKFLNLNIWDNAVSLEQAIKFIKNEKPDILSLQEVCDGKDKNLNAGRRNLGILKNELNMSYYIFSPAFFEMRGEKVESGNAVFSTFPIIKNKTIFFDVPYGERNIKEKTFEYTPRNMQHVKINTGEKILNVFNVQGIWGFDGRDSQRRIDMCKTIANNTKNLKNVILSGDFNVNPDTKSVNQIKAHLTDVFSDKIKTSFNIKRKDQRFADVVVDMVFVSKEINITDSYCPEVDISDHLPLAIIFDVL